MKVILTADVYKHGVAGEVVSVADGFARNYLIPQGLAERVSTGALKAHVRLTETAAARKAVLNNKLNELARQIDGGTLYFGKRAGTNGKLYGSVTTMDIQEALLEATAVDINRRRISQQALRELGEHEVIVRLGSEITPKLNVIIMREEELIEMQAAKDAPVEEVAAVEDAPELAAEKIEALVEEAESNTETLDSDQAAE